MLSNQRPSIASVPLSPRVIGLTSAVITVAIWAAFIVIARASAKGALSPFDIALARIIGASAVLIPLAAWWMRQAARNHTAQSSSFFGLSPLSFRITALCGLFGGFLYAGLSYAGFFFAPAAHASVLMPGSLPLWTSLLAVFILKDHISPKRALGLLFIVCGGLLVGGASLLKAFDGGDVWKGDVLFMGASLCWSIYSVLVRRFALDPVRATAAITVFALFSYVPVYGVLLLGEVMHSQLASAPWGQIIFQALFQGVGSVVISGITFTQMIRYYGPVRSTMITALVPGLSALGAVVFLGEPLGWNLVLGLVCVTVGIVFGVQRSAMKKEAHLPANAKAGA